MKTCEDHMVINIYMPIVIFSQKAFKKKKKKEATLSRHIYAITTIMR